MKLYLKSREVRDFELISAYFHLNREIICRYADYLNENSRAITKESVKKLSDECKVSRRGAFCALLSAYMGLDCDSSPSDEILEEQYVRPYVRLLDAESYKNDPYYKNIKIPNKKLGDWELVSEYFDGYEALIYDDIVIKGEGEYPRIGFFEQPFTFPAVLEGGREWMMITPNEINTMKEPLSHMHGDIVTLGLGMGYFAYMASLKDEVSSVSVVERDENAVKLFESIILPQFEHKEKIKIISADGIHFAQNELAKGRYDCLFADMWRDASDGVPMYVKLKAAEGQAPNVKFYYWAEKTLVATIRQRLFFDLEVLPESENKGDGISGVSQLLAYLDRENIKSMAKRGLLPAHIV